MPFRRSPARRRLAAPAAFVLLSLSVVACSQPAPPAAEAPPPVPLLKNPVGLQLYSLRDSFTTAGVPATLAKVKAMGISHVELAGFQGLTREAFKEELDKAGLTAISMHVNAPDLIANPQTFIDDAKFLGIHYVGDAWFEQEGTFDAADAEAAVAQFNEAGRLLKEAGLQFFYHTHGYEFAPAPGGGTLFDSIVARTDPDNVKFQLDVFWAYHGGVDPAALLRQYPTRFVSTHLKDMKAGTERNHTGGAPDDTSVALGTGVIDIRAVLEAARDSAVEWHIIEEESSSPEVNIPAGLAWLRQVTEAQ